jgi:hypothetical protein
MRDTEDPKPKPKDDTYEPEVIVRRLYHDLKRIAG